MFPCQMSKNTFEKKGLQLFIMEELKNKIIVTLTSFLTFTG